MDGCMPVKSADLGPKPFTCIAPDRLDFWHHLCALPALCRGKCPGVGTSSGSRPAPARGNSQLAELGLDSLQFKPATGLGVGTLVLRVHGPARRPVETDVGVQTEPTCDLNQVCMSQRGCRSRAAPRVAPAASPFPTATALGDGES